MLKTKEVQHLDLCRQLAFKREGKIKVCSRFVLLERHRRLSREWNPKGTSISEEIQNLVGGADQNPLQLKCVPLFRYT